MNGYYITESGIKVILEPKNIIDISYKDIIELVIPDGIRMVYCHNNKLTKLIVPNKVEYISCRNNKLTELIIPDSVTYIDCKFNNLTELVVPDNCEVNCDDTCKVITRTMYNRSKRLKQILR